MNKLKLILTNFAGVLLLIILIIVLATIWQMASAQHTG